MDNFEKEKIYDLIKKELKKYLENEEKTASKKNYEDMNLELAEKFVKEALKYAKEKSLNLSVSVVDKGGNLVLFKSDYCKYRCFNEKGIHGITFK